jgi:hypothetical protein
MARLRSYIPVPEVVPGCSHPIEPSLRPDLGPPEYRRCQKAAVVSGATTLERDIPLRYQTNCKKLIGQGRSTMAIDTSGGNPNMDYAEHTRTYRGFLRLTAWLIAFLVVLLLGMKYFLV